jgi:hypothetical protein
MLFAPVKLALQLVAIDGVLEVVVRREVELLGEVDGALNAVTLALRGRGVERVVEPADGGVEASWLRRGETFLNPETERIEVLLALAARCTQPLGLGDEFTGGDVGAEGETRPAPEVFAVVLSGGARRAGLSYAAQKLPVEAARWLRLMAATGAAPDAAGESSEANDVRRLIAREVEEVAAGMRRRAPRAKTPQPERRAG